VRHNADWATASKPNVVQTAKVTTAKRAVRFKVRQDTARKVVPREQEPSVLRDRSTATRDELAVAEDDQSTSVNARTASARIAWPLSTGPDPDVEWS
jgi:hypothetical protein